MTEDPTPIARFLRDGTLVGKDAELEAVRARLLKALDEVMESAHGELLPLGLSHEEATDWIMYVTGEALRRDRA